MTGSDYQKMRERVKSMDKQLLELCGICCIHFEVGLCKIQDIVEAHGLEIALAVMKRLSTSVRDYTIGPVEQFMKILDAKLLGG